MGNASVSRFDETNALDGSKLSASIREGGDALEAPDTKMTLFHLAGKRVSSVFVVINNAFYFFG